MDDGAIVALVAGVARPQPSGGRVIERAAIMATGSDSPPVIAWIVSHFRGGAAWGNRVAGRSAWLAVYRSRRGNVRPARHPSCRRPARRVLPLAACTSRDRAN